jgi:proteasome lid subunit RPN8/RPN11
MLTITKTDLAGILDHCFAGYPNEVCGILGGRDGMVEKVYLMNNVRPGPTTYEMNPEEQFRVMQDMRDAGLTLVGIFHSHPGGHAYPSSVDVERAYWPGTGLPNYPNAVYVIVSLLDRSTPITRGFTIEEGKVTEISITVVREQGIDIVTK